MAQINKPTDYFDTTLYTGNSSSQTLTMDNLGLLWMKNRTETANHRLFDSVRGGYYISAPAPILSTDTNGGGNGSDVTSAYGITFGSSSSTIGSDGGGYNYNQSGKSYVAWQWRANGTGVANTDGSITSTVSANTTSGFSIVSYSGGGSFGDTVGHGLGSVPAMIIIKTTNATSSWYIWQKNMGATDNQFMDFSTGALQTSGATIFDVSAMSSTTFTLGTNTDVNGSGSPKIAYCFAEKKGFSKFGSYTGNGSTDGTFIYTGFRPAFVMIKHDNASYSDSWIMMDNTRNTFNVINDNLKADLSNAEETNSSTIAIDFLSNGFKCRGTNTQINRSGDPYYFMCFAESPLVGTNNIPATAR